MIRWHQTADVGYVPNKKMPNTFMSVALDTYDVELDHWKGGLHPMNKQTVAHRLAIAGMNIAYGFNNYETRGPWPTSLQLFSK